MIISVEAVEVLLRAWCVSDHDEVIEISPRTYHGIRGSNRKSTGQSYM